MRKCYTCLSLDNFMGCGWAVIECSILDLSFVAYNELLWLKLTDYNSEQLKCISQFPFNDLASLRFYFVFGKNKTQCYVTFFIIVIQV